MLTLNAVTDAFCASRELAVEFYVDNLGRIRSAAITVRPLTVFVGKANTNKTWTAYALYALLRELCGESQNAPFPVPHASSPQTSALRKTAATVAAFKFDHVMRAATKLTDPLVPGQIASINMTRGEILANLPQDIPISFELGTHELAYTLGTAQDTVGGAQVSLAIPNAVFTHRGIYESFSLRWTADVASIIGRTRGGEESQRAVFHVPENPSSLMQYPNPANFKVVDAIRWVAHSIYTNALAFPSERKGLTALAAFLQRDAYFLSPEMAPLSFPAKDFLWFMMQCSAPRKRDPFPSRPLQLLESCIMDGRSRFKEEGHSQVLTYTARNAPTVQIHASASLIRSLAGLELYLRHNAIPGVIMVDEPEMNAHPGAQLQIAELLAILANYGTQVIFTTHSPYIVDHLNNLMAGSSLNESKQRELAKRLTLGDSKAFISPEKVGAYLFCESGEVKNIVNDDALDVRTFSDETDYLAALYGAILRKERGDG